MKVNKIYLKNGISLLNLVSDYVTEEECSISNIYKAYMNDNLMLLVKSIVIDDKTFPVLIISNVKDCSFDYYLKAAMNILERRLVYKKTSFEKYNDIETLKKMSFSDSHYNNGEFVSDSFNNSYVTSGENTLLYDKLYLTSFYGTCDECCIAICPNWYNTYAIEKELKVKNRTHTFKQTTKLFKSGEILSEILTRRDSLYNELENALRHTITAYNDNLLCVMGSRNTFSNNLNLVTINSIKNKELMKKHKTLSVYKVENECISFLSEQEIKEQLKIIKKLEKEEAAFVKKLDKVKTKLSKANKRWFSLNSVEKHNGTWKVWLNPYNQSVDSSGWYTLEELELWLENKGPIVK